MAKFFYTARDSAGKKITSYEESNNQDEVLSRLQSRGLIVLDITSEHDSQVISNMPQSAARARKFHSGVSDDDLVLFCRQLATLLGAGVTILKCLDIIAKQVSSRKLLNVLIQLQKNMEAGLSLHEAMAKHPVFPELWVNLVESGEASGNLAIVLNRLATYLERNAEFKKKIVSALIYPFILFFAGTGALLFLTLKIIPTFAELFKGFNLKLPFLTQILVNMSGFLSKYFIVILIGIVVTVFLFRKFINTKEGRRRYELFLLNLPMLGEFFRALAVEKFSSGMSTLIESGVPILYSLEITEHSVGNSLMAEAIRNIKDEVRNGKTLSAPMEASGFFEPMVVQMVGIGEEIGELSQMFKKINSFYQDYVETFLVRFTAMFEPVMLIFMGGVIGIMVVGMFLPIFQLTKIGGGS
ncbi:MAG TPA: type II secretion system F family protein [Candidatus Omnitrophota bacterium]|nr:type II secretion system F family protein [Candidatus Omnitrophota bacterium]HPT06527.1 type II secretion system F family protein [Candidatus Omnitrophota bacterium]